MSPLLKRPWVQVFADLCGPSPSGELVLDQLDAYSRYPEIEIVKSTSAETLAFEKIFLIHVIPEEMKTGNGTPFQSEAFSKFSEDKGFIHRKITPVWPEAKGHVKNFVKNIGKVAN